MTSPPLSPATAPLRGIVRTLAATIALFTCSLAAADVQFQVNEQQLWMWVFENASGAPQARQHAEDLLIGQVEFVAAIGTLSPDQRVRLELAGQGDIARFFAKAEELIDSLPKGNVTQEEYNDLWQKISPIRTRFSAGLHQSGSLFQKAVPTVLNAEQLKQYQANVHERKVRHYRALVTAGIADLENKLPLTHNQRTGLIELVMSRTEPPTVATQGHMMYRLVLYRLTQIPEAELKPLFPEPAEWKLIQALMQESRNWGRQFDNPQAAQVMQWNGIFF